MLRKVMLAIEPGTVDSAGKASFDNGAAFKVMMNPSGYTHTYSIDYNEKSALGQPAPNPRFNAMGQGSIKFKDLVIDGTGVVPLSLLGDDVETQITKLNQVVYSYDGDSHEPRVVRLLWGSLSFVGRLKNMTVDYTLFKPNGKPLRAKVGLEFASFKTIAEAKKEANQTSPDLTHLVEVKSGDTLPLMCHRIYKNSAYYVEVARINGLVSFRDLKPGMRLRFPPLR